MTLPEAVAAAFAAAGIGSARAGSEVDAASAVAAVTQPLAPVDGTDTRALATAATEAAVAKALA